MVDYYWEIANTDTREVVLYAEKAKISRPLALVMLSLGIAPEDVDAFLHPTLSQLGDPFDLVDNDKAALRLWDAIRNGERILIYGDYDTDGITASALMSWVLKKNGAEVDVFLPHRIDNGYGLTIESIQKTIDDHYQLLVTVDCGITCYEAINYADQHGLDVIITDHHMPGSESFAEDTIIVDPKLPGNPDYLYNLAGVGVAFKVCHAFLKYGRSNGLCACETNLKDVLDLVALGTVADIVPLIHENRVLVRYGLKILSEMRRPGIHALCDICNIKPPLSSQDITFRLAPRLNAAGRMGDPSDSLALLEASSMHESWELAKVLKNYNQQRQQEEEFAICEAETQISELYPNLETVQAIVVCQLHWHQGILGILASRLARKYNRPCIVLASDGNGILNGSGRSVLDIDLIEVLGNCSELLDRFGGHAMAAGLSLREENLTAFRTSFEQSMKSMAKEIPDKSILSILGEVSFSEISRFFQSDYTLLEPFGHNNPIPVFITRDISVVRIEQMGFQHCRGVMEDYSGATVSFVAFNMKASDFPKYIEELVYNPHINYSNGRQYNQIRIVDYR